jgi:hypothetical protein
VSRSKFLVLEGAFLSLEGIDWCLCPATSSHTSIQNDGKKFLASAFTFTDLHLLVTFWPGRTRLFAGNHKTPSQCIVKLKVDLLPECSGIGN